MGLPNFVIDFHMHDDCKQLKHAARAKVAKTKTAKKAILDAHGVQFSVLNELPGWLPTSLIKQFIYDEITVGYLLDSVGLELYEVTIRSIIWPLILDNDHALPKADQWCCLSNILPFVLNSKNQLTFQCNVQAIYKLYLYLAVSECILANKSMLSLSVHQTINSHLAMHYSVVFKHYGPAYATWLFGFECFNGVLEDVNLNGHGGREMECSLAHNWIEKHSLYELESYLPT
ncbi:hypothetical protein F5J12DRAFT_907339 [Pisolithus orientalis]|uniref:uncharacterized protein n=1 Tax=Pisolithus orientalis TaxID=936130 RepID=UPI0022257843|nr:uncharacterized protein F5J12DRAFT_907339 [Pisolithus orientalis]KAI5993137.1 hypothetical protein F5J12DRAFT_907339 [Pisolithus orientalis]